MAIELHEGNLSISDLQNIAKESAELHQELSLKVGYNLTSRSLIYKVVSGESTSISSFVSTLRPFSEDFDYCVSTHTHYALEGVDERSTIFLSTSDLEELMLRGMPGKPSEHLGSFFVLSPQGITMICGVSRLEDLDSSRESMWFKQAAGTTYSIGTEADLDLSSIDLSEPNLLSVDFHNYGMRLDTVYIPFSQLNSMGIELQDILFEEGLAKLLNSLGKDMEVKSVVEMIRKVKQTVAEVIG